MSNRFFCSDHHFGHANILTFKRNDGTPLRDFATIEEHDEVLIRNHNAVVGTKDSVYFLGDVVINRRNLGIIGRLNGRKKLVRGNHDIFKTEEYLLYFEEILGCRVFNGYAKRFICTHIPIHPESLSRWNANVHGHLHANRVEVSKHHLDTRYVNVCMEHINYTPIHVEDLLKRIV